MNPHNPPQTAIPGVSGQYETVAQAIRYLKTHARRHPDLGELAREVGLSETHLQKVFTAWAGVSPKRFLQYLSKEYALTALREMPDVLAAADESGLSGPGRLHDLMVSCEAMTPGEIRQGGAGVDIRYGCGDTPFGIGLVAWTARGICHLVFIDDDAQARFTELRQRWPAARLTQDTEGAFALLARVFAATTVRSAPLPPLRLLLRGTNFQIKVWEALLRVPAGHRLSYSRLADIAGVPRAQRAVGSAMAANCLGYLIPCHRVIREDGDTGHYRWSDERKPAMLAWEAARRDSAAGA